MQLIAFIIIIVYNPPKLNTPQFVKLLIHSQMKVLATVCQSIPGQLSGAGVGEYRWEGSDVTTMTYTSQPMSASRDVTARHGWAKGGVFYNSVCRSVAALQYSADARRVQLSYIIGVVFSYLCHRRPGVALVLPRYGCVCEVHQCWSAMLSRCYKSVCDNQHQSFDDNNNSKHFCCKLQWVTTNGGGSLTRMYTTTEILESKGNVQILFNK